jgi:hypothetical protein
MEELTFFSGENEDSAEGEGFLGENAFEDQSLLQSVVCGVFTRPTSASVVTVDTDNFLSGLRGINDAHSLLSGTSNTMRTLSR